MSTPPVAGLAAPVAGLTVKPIGFSGEPAGFVPVRLGLPTADVVLNGAQVDVPLVPHTSIGWTVMKQGTSPGNKGSSGKHWPSTLPDARQATKDEKQDQIARPEHDFQSFIVSLPSIRSSKSALAGSNVNCFTLRGICSRYFRST